MRHEEYQDISKATNTGLLQLILAFFVPLYFCKRHISLKSSMLYGYAAVYLKRNTLAALFTITLGQLLYIKEYVFVGMMISGLCIIFTGLCSTYLVAMIEKSRNSKQAGNK